MGKKVHFLGIGGSGASAVAALAQAQGFEVTGCDLQLDNEFTKGFQPSQLFTGHNPKHLASHISGGNVDILAVTPAIFSLDPDNPELLEAKKRHIPIMTWQQFLGEYLTKGKFVIAVCGTHGKTTTTAMVAKLLEDAGLDPTVELGAIVPWWKSNYRIPKQKLNGRQYFVIEADEFNDNFLHFKPDITVVTNIEMDHPEYFKDFTAVQASFKQFLLQTKNIIFANLKDPGAAEVLKLVMKESKTACFDYSNNLYKLDLKIPGDFNKLNASAAFEVGLALGIDPQIIRDSLQNYPGVSRRFEYIGNYNGAQIYSDFGHHPTEIAKTMQAAREKFPKNRILLVYQPHMFSRTKALFDNFVTVFQNLPVDKTFILDIYPSREVDTGLVTSKQLVKAINKSTVTSLGGIVTALKKVKPEIKPKDIVFFMGAGDTDKLAKELAKKKVLIFGLGLNQGGVGSAKFFAKQGAEVKVTDLKNKDDLKPSLEQLKEFKNMSYTLGGHRFEDVDWADLIIKNPAVKPGNLYIEYALKKGKTVETEMEIFLQYVKPNQIIGVTGTKGKSTTASLIYEILKKRTGAKLIHPKGGIGWHVLLAGNIGKSVLEIIPKVKKYTLVVLEISSFQLEAFDKLHVSPKWAVITNITPDHLNYYQNMDEYIHAKRIIGKYQNPQDFLFIKKNDPIVDRNEFLAGLAGKISYFSPADLPKNFHPALAGDHNLNNIVAAYQIGKAFNINSNLLLDTLANFKGIPFRIELIKEWNGIKIYNDSAATTPEAGIQAIRTGAKLIHLEGGIILICGGMNKKMDYTKYAQVIGKNVQQVFFLEGDATKEIQIKLTRSFKMGKVYNNLEKLLEDVKRVVKPGDIVLFSPAATSFNLFQNEFDRGRKFNQAVMKVFS